MDWQIYNKTTAEIGRFDANGFLRIKMRVGAIGVLKYNKKELPPAVVKDAKDDAVFNVLRDEGSIFEKESMESIEGIPILAYDHEWVLPENSGKKTSRQTTPRKSQVGQVAGIAKKEGGFLIADGIITDANIIKQIREQKLLEISPAYISEIKDIQGSWKGKKYDFVQGGALYNHILLIPKNQAREKKLKILNKKGDKMPDQTIGIHTQEGMITIAPESKEIVNRLLQTLQKNKDTLSKNETELKNLVGKKEEIKKLQDQVAELNKKKDEYKGKIDALKVQLDEASSPKAIESMAEEMKNTDSIINGIGDQHLIASTKGMKIADKKKQVVQFYMDKQGQKLSDKDLTPDYINGAWQIIADSMTDKKPETNVPVSSIFDAKTNNSSADNFAYSMGYKTTNKKEA